MNALFPNMYYTREMIDDIANGVQWSEDETRVITARLFSKTLQCWELVDKGRFWGKVYVCMGSCSEADALKWVEGNEVELLTGTV
jgi:hypothetical protein